MTEREKLEKRLEEIDRQIAEYPYWGAFLTAINEERRAILRNLGT